MESNEVENRMDNNIYKKLRRVLTYTEPMTNIPGGSKKLSKNCNKITF